MEDKNYLPKYLTTLGQVVVSGKRDLVAIPGRQIYETKIDGEDFSWVEKTTPECAVLLLYQSCCCSCNYAISNTHAIPCDNG